MERTVQQLSVEIEPRAEHGGRAKEERTLPDHGNVCGPDGDLGRRERHLRRRAGAHEADAGSAPRQAAVFEDSLHAEALGRRDVARHVLK